MQNSTLNRQAPVSFARRFDRMFGEINAVLVAVALGLAVLDFTGFVTLRAVDSLAAAQRQMDQQGAPAGVASPPQPAVAAQR
jgi:hypothetical protein